MIKPLKTTEGNKSKGQIKSCHRDAVCKVQAVENSEGQATWFRLQINRQEEKRWKAVYSGRDLKDLVTSYKVGSLFRPELVNAN